MGSCNGRRCFQICNNEELGHRIEDLLVVERRWIRSVNRMSSLSVYARLLFVHTPSVNRFKRAPKATLGSVPCEYVLVCPELKKHLCIECLNE